MEIRTQNNQNFGWSYGDHKNITLFAARGLKNIEPYKAQFRYFSKLPDFKEQGFFNNWHFYSPAQRKSFFDFKRKDNALAKYNMHIANMLLALDNKNIKQVVEQAGEALHYLQDMTQPMHTQKGFIFNKILCLKKHIAFETYVKENQYEFIDSYIEKELPKMSFEQLFLENVEKSSKIDIPFKKELPKESVKDPSYPWKDNSSSPWKIVGRDGIHQAIFSSKIFLTKLNGLMDSFIDK